MKHYTNETWPGSLAADNEDVLVTVAAGAAAHEYIIYGDATGSITVSGEGNGDVRRSGRGNGDAVRHGLGGGSAVRNGEGTGSAHRSGSGWGYAYRNGSGNGSAFRDGVGEGSAYRNENCPGSVCLAGSDKRHETDAMGTRYRINAPQEIKYTCTYGDGHLRIGCEIHTLADWIDNADEIDEKHGQVIAAHTRALALELAWRLQQKKIEDTQ